MKHLLLSMTSEPSPFFQHRKVVRLEEVRSLLQGRLVLGFSGYTKPPAGSDYIQTANAVVHQTIQHHWQRFGTDIAVVYGSSDAGIDQIVEQTCQSEAFADLAIIGITCPAFANWVPDEAERPPVVVCSSVQEYGELFTDLLTLLVITGGREHTVRHDLMALAKGKQVIVCDCAPEHRPAFADGKIQNAAALLTEHLHVVNQGEISELLARMERSATM